jgi:thymidylate synthase
MKNEFDAEYNKLIDIVTNDGHWKFNKRTDINCLTFHSEKAVYDLSTGFFPAITTKKFIFKAMVAELLGFIRGYNNAGQFRELGCNFWDANANETESWLKNPNRKGVDDLGRIYGVQGRHWRKPNGEEVDQFKDVYEKISKGIDDRRLIINYWNPGELEEMALPPCHDFYQFHLYDLGDDRVLDLSMYQRSNDIPLGTPVNIASSSLLLLLMCRITNCVPGKFTHFMGDLHVYENQLDLLSEQRERIPYVPPKIEINESITSLWDLETWVTPSSFKLIDYEHHPAISFPFAA